MSLSRRCVALWVLCLLVPLSACRKGKGKVDEGPKLAVVQALASDLGVAKRLKQRRGCELLVESQRDVLLCDGMLQTLLHYAPGFAGSRVSVRAPSTGGAAGQPVLLPVRYQGPLGEGALDVQLVPEGKTWRVLSLLPR